MGQPIAGVVNKPNSSSRDQVSDEILQFGETGSVSKSEAQIRKEVSKGKRPMSKVNSLSSYTQVSDLITDLKLGI